MRHSTGSGLRVGGLGRAAPRRQAADPGAARAARAARAPARAVIPKATCAAECQLLEQLPNIGVSIAADLRSIGIQHPRELIVAEPMALYQTLSATTGKRQDPCVLDTFMAAVDFMQGAAPAPWWQYTVRRKALYGQIDAVQNVPQAVVGPPPKPAAASDAQPPGAKDLCAHG